MIQGATRSPVMRTWVATRIVMVVLALLFTGLAKDLLYYVSQAHHHSLLHGMREYPFPVAVALMLPARWLPYAWYVAAFVAMAVAADLVCVRLLARHAGTSAALRWTIYTALLGPMIYLRFDLLAAFSLVLVLVWSATRPGCAGLAAAFGSAIKLWPAVFGVGLMGPLRRRLRHAGAAVAGGLTWIVTTALIAGPERVTSPLTWQGKRGFEVESLWGALFGLERVFGSSVVMLHKRQGSWEYVGASPEQWMFLVKPTQYVGYVLALVLLALGARAGRDERSETVALTMAAVVSVLILTSPVLSPQYLLWLIPGLVLVRDRAVRWLSVIVLALTQLEFPILFDGVRSPYYVFEVSLRLVILTRNAVLLALAVRLAVLLWQRVKGPGRHPDQPAENATSITLQDA